MSLLLLVVSALHILILILLFVATLDKVSFQLTVNPSYGPALKPVPPTSTSGPVLSPRPAHPFGPPVHTSQVPPCPLSCPDALLTLAGLCPSQSWWTLPEKESLNLWYDCTWNTTTQTWACSNVSENGECLAEGTEGPQIGQGRGWEPSLGSEHLGLA